jgi:hypothetical protein
MTDILDAARTAIGLQSARDDIRRIFGDDYASKVQPYRELIRDTVAKSGRPLLQVVLAMGKAAKGRGIVFGLVLAAACDELEEAGA